MSTPAKIALITGAGTGVGKAVSLGLLKLGFNVVLAGRRLDTLQQVIAEANLPPTRTLAVPTDVANPDSVAALFDALQKTFGRLDLLFNNAGVSIPGIPLEEVTPAQWRTTLDTNVTGTFLCTQHAFRLMKSQTPQGGRIINNGSISAHIPRPQSAPYTASKFAVTGLTKATSLDGRKFGIVCGQIDIGNAATKMAARMSTGVMQANGTIATEPLIDVAHVANAVLYMASLPLEVNVPNITVMASTMPYAGRG